MASPASTSLDFGGSVPKIVGIQFAFQQLLCFSFKGSVI